MVEASDPMEYRALSKTAILSFLLAMLGALSVLVPQLTVVAIAAALVAVLALVRIRKSSAHTGAGLAVVALCVSIACASSVIAHTAIHSRLLVKEARQNAEIWFDLVAKKEFQVAHQLMFPEHERRPKGADLQIYYATAKAADPMAEQSPQELLEDSFDAPSMRHFLSFFDKGKWPKFLRSLGALYDGDYQLVRLEYGFEGSSDRFLVVFRRRVDDLTGETTWQFWRVDQKFMT